MRVMRTLSWDLRFAHGIGLVRSHKRVSLAGRIANVDFVSSRHRRCGQAQGAPRVLGTECEVKAHASWLQDTVWDSKNTKQGYPLHRNVVYPRSMDEGSLGISPLDDWGNNEGSEYMIFSSDGEDTDGEILVIPINDVDMPTIKKQFVAAEDALTATAHKLAILGRRHKKYRITYIFVTNLGVITFMTLVLAFVDWHAWHVVRLPLDTFYFLSPFLVSAFLVACAGFVSVPILKRFNIRQKFKRKWHVKHYSTKGTVAIGGLFFVPIGVSVAKFMSGSSMDVSGLVAVTVAFSAIGLLDDTLGYIKYSTFGLPRRTRFILEVAVAAWFSFWLYTKDISSPYGMYTFLF